MNTSASAPSQTTSSNIDVDDVPLMASTMKDLTSLMNGILTSLDVSTSVNSSDENTYFEDSYIKYNYISTNTEEESSTTDSLTATSSSTESSPGTFFEDSGIRYVVYCDESFEVIELINNKNPSHPRSGSIILSSTDSSTVTFFEDSDIKYVACVGKEELGINNSHISSSPREQTTRSILSPSTESFTGTYDEEGSFISNPSIITKTVLSSTESSTVKLLDDSGVNYLVYCDDKGSSNTDSFNRTIETNSSTGTYFEESSPTKCSSTFNNSQDPLAETNSSTGTYFEESSPSKFNSSHDNTSLIPDEQVNLSENKSFVLLNMSDISLRNGTGDRLQIAVPMKMFHKKLLQSLTRK